MMAESASISIVPIRGACVTMLMPPRAMYVSTPSGVVPSELNIQRLPASIEKPREPLAAGHDGHGGQGGPVVFLVRLSIG